MKDFIIGAIATNLFIIVLFGLGTGIVLLNNHLPQEISRPLLVWLGLSIYGGISWFFINLPFRKK